MCSFLFAFGRRAAEKNRSSLNKISRFAVFTNPFPSALEKPARGSEILMFRKKYWKGSERNLDRAGLLPVLAVWLILILPLCPVHAQSVLARPASLKTGAPVSSVAVVNVYPHDAANSRL